MRARRALRQRLIVWLGPLAAPVMVAALRLTARRAGLVLIYHAVAEREGDAQRELLPPIARERFEAQMRHVRRHYRAVSIAQLAEAIAARRRGGRFPVAVTFDDDLAEHVDHALGVLDRTGVPGTFFLCGSFLDPDAEDFWWVRLQRAHDRGADLARVLPGGASALADLAWEVQNLPLGDRDAASARIAELAGPDEPHLRLGAEGARRLAAAGHTIGFHTRRHPALPTLDDAELRAALRDGREELAALAGQPVDAIAYPHGAWDDRVAAAAAEAGFRLGFTTRREAVVAGQDPLRLGRTAPLGRARGEWALGLLRALRTDPR